jgi:hypothetical protein
MQWETEEAFERLLGLLLEHRDVVDEVALFDSITHHLYIPLDDYARRMELAARRLDAGKAGGRVTLRNVPSWGLQIILLEE